METLPHYPLNGEVMRKVPNLSFVENPDLRGGGCDCRQWRAGVSFPTALSVLDLASLLATCCRWPVCRSGRPLGCRSPEMFGLPSFPYCTWIMNELWWKLMVREKNQKLTAKWVMFLCHLHGNCYLSRPASISDSEEEAVSITPGRLLKNRRTNHRLRPECVKKKPSAGRSFGFS